MIAVDYHAIIVYVKIEQKYLIVCPTTFIILLWTALYTNELYFLCLNYGMSHFALLIKRPTE